MINVCTPFRPDKNLGRAYNDTIALYGENSWVCVIDHDVLFLTPDAIKIMGEYAKRFPTAGILTAYCSRLHPQSKDQLLGGICSEDDEIRAHIRLAEQQKSFLYQATEIKHDIGGFLMLINKSTWENIKFNEDKHCLGVDTDFSRRVLASGRNILRMDGLYVWHSYRLIGGYKDKKHLL